MVKIPAWRSEEPISLCSTFVSYRCYSFSWPIFAVAAVEQLMNAETPLATPVDVEQPFAAKGSYFVLEVSHLSCLETRISLQERPKL